MGGVLYDARAAATPSQRMQHWARQERQHRIAALAKTDDRPITCLSASVRAASFTFGPPPPIVIEEPQPVLPQLPPVQIQVTYSPFEPDVSPITKRPSTRRIQKEVLKHFADVTINDLLSARRTAHVVMPRQVAMYITRATTKWSMPAIGRQFGGRDHTTVLHAERKIARLIRQDIEIAQIVGEIINELGCADA